MSFIYFDPVPQRTPLVSEIADEIDRRHINTLKDEQKTAIDGTIFCLGVFFSLVLNFNFHAFMSETLLFGSQFVIKFFDNLGFEVHFVRMVYLTLFDHS